jgi:hypothetical protein
MTARARRPARRRPARPASRLLSRVRWAGALASTIALALLCLPGSAHADSSSGYDQITGQGPTSSAITVKWTQGILDDTNTPIVGGQNALRTDTSATPSASDPLSFMHSDFENLQVTVSQTQDIAHQGITVSWTGGEQSGAISSPSDFLQMMECYGDDSSGPDPEDCEYGSPGIFNTGTSTSLAGLSSGITERTGDVCAANAVPDPSSPSRAADGSSDQYGCDPEETPTLDPIGAGSSCPSADCGGTNYDIPFAPVSDPTDYDYTLGSSTYFDKYNTNEVQMALTGANGTGEQVFEALTGIQASWLGCGDPDNSEPRGCWLVIVPRGTFEPNGFQVTAANGLGLASSPLSTSNWDQRIQIHLSYLPVGSFCPTSTPSVNVDGTQVVQRAMQSWELALNQASNCASEYSFIATTESSSTSDVSSGSTGLAFTTIPIGSEATRDGGSPPTLPPILYAPVAISALGFGFNINFGSSGFVTTSVKLTPLLLAKALTQSYYGDLPDYTGVASSVPSWAANNPINISKDPQFDSLNPDIPEPPFYPEAPLLTQDQSGLNEQVWQWIQADSTASGWLDGTPDATDANMAVDPDYQSLNLGEASTVEDSYPRAYTGTRPADNGVAADNLDSVGLLPYAQNLDNAAADVLAGDDLDTGSWSPLAVAPDGSLGYWQATGVQPTGAIFQWAVSDTPSLAAYGLVDAQLCNDSGSTCVAPSEASVTAAVTDAQPDSAGLLQVNPASPGNGAYPLVDVIYAAVATNSSAAELTSYANLISYAAGSDGQTPGTAPGDLPPGYLPLTSSLQAQAMGVVTQLQALANPSASPSPSASATSSSSSAGSQPDNQSQSLTGGSSTASATPSGSTTGSSVGGSGTKSGSGTSSGSGTGKGSGTDSGTGAGSSPGPTASATSRSSAGAVPEPTGSLRASPGSSATTPGPVVSLPAAQAVSSGQTELMVVGNLRWALIAVVILGALCVGGAMLLRSGPLPPWLRRRVPASWRVR